MIMSTVANNGNPSSPANTSASLAARLGLGDEVRHLKLGKSFSTFSSSSANHTSSLGSKSNGKSRNCKTNGDSSPNGFKPSADAFHTLKCESTTPSFPICHSVLFVVLLFELSVVYVCLQLHVCCQIKS